MDNLAISKALFELAELSKAAGENAFKSRAYRTAAQAIKDFPTSVESIADRLPDKSLLPGVGEGIARKIKQLISEGKIKKTEELRSETPYSPLLDIRGIGPVTARELYETHGITQPEQLQELMDQGKITDSRVLVGLKAWKATGNRRFNLSFAQDVVQSWLYILQARGIPYNVCGSYARMEESVGDMDILVCGQEDSLLNDFHDWLDDQLGAGPTKVSGLKHGVQVDLRLVKPDSYGAALLYFIGSKEFNVTMRQICIDKGLLLNEYGLYRNDEYLVGRTQEEIFNCLGLPWVPPVLRSTDRFLRVPEEMKGLIDKVPGDIHVHTLYSDGDLTLSEVKALADAFGYSYVGIADHSAKMTFAHGISDEGSSDQVKEIRKLNTIGGTRLLAFRESEIYGEGEVDLPPNYKDLDGVIASLHYRKKNNTSVILNALNCPMVKVLGHPTARLVEERPPMDADWDAIFRTCAGRGIALEINAHPSRLDLNVDMVKKAKALGCKFVIGTDCHSRIGMNDARYGLAIAQKSGLTIGDLADF